MNLTNETVKLKIRRPNKIVTAAVGVALAACMVAMLAVNLSLSAERDRVRVLKDQAQQLQQENDRLEDKIGAIGSVESVEQIAKDELGLVDPDTVIVRPEN